MKQKTEASQAVEELVRACKAATSDAEKVAAIDAYRAALKAQPAPTEAANPDLGIRRSTQGEDSARLGDGYKSSTMVSDFYGAGKVTIHYETARQAESAHNALVIMFNRESAETGGANNVGL